MITDQSQHVVGFFQMFATLISLLIVVYLLTVLSLPPFFVSPRHFTSTVKTLNQMFNKSKHEVPFCWNVYLRENKSEVYLLSVSNCAITILSRPSGSLIYHILWAPKALGAGSIFVHERWADYLSTMAPKICQPHRRCAEYSSSTWRRLPFTKFIHLNKISHRKSAW